MEVFFQPPARVGQPAASEVAQQWSAQERPRGCSRKGFDADRCLEVCGDHNRCQDCHSRLPSAFGTALSRGVTTGGGLASKQTKLLLKDLLLLASVRKTAIGMANRNEQDSRQE
eukprot:COSAG02_NODE_227_length_28153_cov_11.662294_19_plen_114_part_00